MASESAPSGDCTTNGEPIDREIPVVTLTGLQSLIRTMYSSKDEVRGVDGTFMWLIEEIGELATTLQKIKGEGGNTSGGSTHEDLEGEFADVLAWLCTLANINDVGLTTAITKKYLAGGGPKGHK